MEEEEESFKDEHVVFFCGGGGVSGKFTLQTIVSWIKKNLKIQNKIFYVFLRRPPNQESELKAVPRPSLSITVTVVFSSTWSAGKADEFKWCQNIWLLL